MSAGRQQESEKRSDVEDLLKRLEEDLDNGETISPKHGEMLQRLRSYMTSAGGLEPLFTARGVDICCNYGFGQVPSTTSRLARRCLCNIMLLAEPTRQMFVDRFRAEETLKQMKNDDPVDELISARLLLLSTYGTNMNFDQLFAKHNLAEIINKNITRRASLFSSTLSGISPPADDLAACSESLKLLYNLTANFPTRTPLFRDSLVPILDMLKAVPVPDMPLESPICWLINALLPLASLYHEDHDESTLTNHPIFPASDDSRYIGRFVYLLELSAQKYDEEQMDQKAAALLQLILTVAASAPPSPKEYLQSYLLPSYKDQDNVLGTGDSLPARLLRLSTSPATRHLRELIPAIFFELSDQDEEKLVRNIGYGFAAGFLLSRRSRMPIPGTADASNTTQKHKASNVASSGKDEKDDNDNLVEVNPVTGQRRDKEPQVDLPEMSDEEKEREAERLFVLFERLRATGVVDARNPVETAVQEGRFEELE